MEVSPPPDHVVANGEKGLRLNFRNAPLELVLNYLSEAAGFIIMPGGADVSGKLTVWSAQPLTKEEAVGVLSTALTKNGYTAILNGRTLKILSTDTAKKEESPVIVQADPEFIPKTDQVVTQIIPVKFIDASQLSRDLQQLIVSPSSLVANQGGNSLIITDTQSHVRRVAEIVKALDNAISSVSKVQVFPLKSADARSVANVVKELFQSQDTGQNRGPGGGPARFFNFMRGGGPGGPGEQNTGPANGRAPTPRVTAVANERSNAVVVSAPEDQMLVIDSLIKDIDKPVDEITDLRVFRLKNADPQDIASQLAALFPDQTTQGQGRGMFRFGGPFGGGMPGMPGGGRGANNANTSERMLKQTKVVAVADQRTGSVVVLAARDLMEQIAGMIQELDNDAARKQQVFVFDVQNTDPTQVQEILQSLFPNQTTGGYGGSSGRFNRNQAGVGNQLNTRAQQNQNMGINRNAGFGNTGMGGNRVGGQ
jgi:general secretion pathway protein D